MSGPVTRAAVTDLARALRAGVAARRVTETGVVQSVTRDANGFPTAATVRVGDVDVPGVPLVGRAARVGDVLLLSRAAGQVAAPEWQVDGYVSSLSPAAPLDDDVTIPAPTWGSPALATAVVTPFAGGQHATVTARVRETPERYGPERTEVQWASDADAVAGRWASTQVGNVGGQDAELVVVLPAALPFGLTLNVRARAWTSGGARSPWSDTRTVVTATDATTPGAPTGFTVDVTKHLTAIVTLPTLSQPLVFDHWDVSIATSAAGAGAVTYQARAGQYVHTTAVAQAIYVRIREVTRAGVAGGWYPSGSWAGPYQVAATDSWVDTTPPAAPVVSSVNAATELVQGVMGVTLTAALAAYTPPSDFAWFEWQLWDGTAAEYRQTQEASLRVLAVRQGVTYRVIARAWDTSGNASAWSGGVTVVTPTIGAPAGAPAVTFTLARFRAVFLVWSKVADGASWGRIVSYELQRNRSDEAATTWLGVTITDALSYVHTNVSPDLQYRYRVRALNADGVAGPWSVETGFITPLRVDDGDINVNSIHANRIRVGTITADRLAADMVLASTIRAQGADGAAGRIFAGSAVLLNANGVTINAQAGLRFRGGDLESGTVVGYLGPVANWQGSGLDGLLVQTSSGTARGRLFVASNSLGDSGMSMLVSDYEVRQLYQATPRSGFDGSWFYNPEGVRAYLYRPNYVAVGNVTSSTAHVTSGYTYRMERAQMGAPGNTAAVQVRVSNAGAGVLYVARGSGAQPEDGMVLPASGGHDTGLIELSYGFGGEIYFWSPSTINCYVHVLGYCR